MIHNWMIKNDISYTTVPHVFGGTVWIMSEEDFEIFNERVLQTKFVEVDK